MRRTTNHTGSTASIAPPTIVSFSPDSNIIGDGITDANVLTLSGSAIADSSVSVLDGTTLLGTVQADANGAWTFPTGTLTDGVHAFTVTDSSAGNTSLASNVESITVDTHAPTPPVIVSEATTGINQEIFSGTAEANSKVAIYDGTTQLGTAAADGSGAWSFTSGTLAVGLQKFIATAMDAAGNISLASQPVSLNIGIQNTGIVAPTLAAVQTTGIAEPGAAALQNYNHLAFDDEFNSYSTIDVSNSHSSGFNWYLQNWFSTGSTNSNNVTISNGVLELGGGTGTAALVSAFANSSGGATGTVFGSGAYMEASILFNPSGGSGATVWPAFWGEAIQHVIGTDQWAGQSNGYSHFAEVDIMEYMNGFSSTQYNGAIHDWSGTYSTSSGWAYNVVNYGNNIINVGSIDWSVCHTYGLLWVPQSGSTPGHVTWYFDGHAESSVYWLGPATSTSLPGINGDSFTPSSSGQAATTYSVLDSDQLALSLQTDSSWPMYVDWVRVWQQGSTSASAIATPAPTVTTFSPDSGVVGDGITNAETLTVSGTAEANSVVLLYDGTTWLGSASADSNGAWSFTTGSLADGTHNFTATDTDALGNTSAASAALAVTVDTVAPMVTESLSKDTGSSSTDKITSNDTLTGLGDPNAVVHFTVDGQPVAGNATANASGAWTFAPTGLSDGTHTIVASEMDAAGNTATSSLTFTLDTKPPAVTIGNETLSNGKVTLTGITAEAADKVSVDDGSTFLGTTVTNSDGTWSFTTGSVPNAVHTYTVTASDTAGNVGNSSNEAILGSTKADTLVGTSGNDIIIGNGGNDTFVGGAGADTLIGGGGSDTFVFKAVTDSTAAVHDVIFNFNHISDKIEFTGIAGINTTHGIAAFQGQLSGSGNLTLNAHSVGYIEMGGNTEVLVNTANSAETVTALDAHAANMEIVLAGIHLGLTNSDFHVV